jgi:hypothetical protein
MEYYQVNSLKKKEEKRQILLGGEKSLIEDPLPSILQCTTGVIKS